MIRTFLNSKTRKTQNTIHIDSKIFFLFLSYLVFIWLCEVADLVCFLFGFPQVTVLSRLIVIGVFGFILYVILPNITFGKNKFNYVFFVAGAFLIVGLGFFKGMRVDVSFDTGNYHLIAQNPSFINYFDQHYGLGNFQIWGFRLSDRLFYPFRFILGLRMGTLFNSLILSICYYQLIQILRELSNGKLKKWTELYALIILLGQDCLFTLGNYYVDTIGIPLCLEIVRLMIKAQNTHINSAEIIYFSILNGFLFALKMTNIVYCIPAVLLFIFLCKKIKIKIFLISGIGCCLPCFVYLIFNFLCTGNPIFPYFNTIFQSPYFTLENFKDNRWGGQNLFEKIFWGIYSVLNPEYRQSEIHNTNTYIYVIGIVGIIIYVIIFLFNKWRKKQYKTLHIELIVFWLSSSALWGITTGYSRYFAFGMILLSIIGYQFLDSISKMPYFYEFSYILILFAILITHKQVYDWLDGREWSWSKVDGASIEKNINYIFKDQKYEGTYNFSNKTSFVLSESYYGGYANWISDDSYILNLSCDWISELEKEHFKNNLYNICQSGSVYDIKFNDINLDEYGNSLKQYGLKVDNITKVDSNIGTFSLVELKLETNY